jgi:hypothetical protein
MGSYGHEKMRHELFNLSCGGRMDRITIPLLLLGSCFALADGLDATSPPLLEVRPVEPLGVASQVGETRAARDLGNAVCKMKQTGTDCSELLKAACDGPLFLGVRALSEVKRMKLAEVTCTADFKAALESAVQVQKRAIEKCEQATQSLEKQCAASDGFESAKKNLQRFCSARREYSVGTENLLDFKTCPGAAYLQDQITAKAFARPQNSEKAKSGTSLAQDVSLESTFINGLLTFVQDRARDEAVTFALDQVSTDLCAKADNLFVATCALVKASAQTRATVVPGRLLHEAIADDLRLLGLRLAQSIVADPKLELPNRQLVVCGLVVSQQIVVGLQRRLPPPRLLQSAVERLGADTSCKEGLHTEKGDFALVMRTVEDLVRAVVHAKPEEIPEFERDFESFKKLVLTAQPSPPDLARTAEMVDRLGPLVLQLIRDINDLSASKPGDHDVHAKALIGSSLVFFFGAADAVLETQTDADNPRRGADRRILQTLEELTTRLLTNDFAGAFSAILKSGLIPSDKEPFASVVRFGTLLVDVATAQSSDEVASAIEAAASPPGSWLSRRKRPMLGITAMFGLNAGGEFIADASAVKPGATLGLFVPIGLDLSVPLVGDFTLGFMLRVLDLGALATARVSGLESVGVGKTEVPKAEPVVSFLQVLSLGLTVSVGLGKSPFVFFISGGYSPAHRVIVEQVGMEPAVNVAHSVWRLGGGFAIDVPIFVRGL